MYPITIKRIGIEHSLTETFDAAEDFVGGSSPSERLWICIIAVDKGSDSSIELDG